MEEEAVNGAGEEAQRWGMSLGKVGQGSPRTQDREYRNGHRLRLQFVESAV